MVETRERTFIMCKPDAVQRKLIHKVVLRMEKRGFQLVALKLCKPDRAHFEEHYAEHKGKPFFPAMLQRITAGPVCAMVFEGDGVIATSRTIIGATDPQKAEIGTIRGDYGLNLGMNAVHGSDSVESAAREIALWFKPEEVLSVNGVSEPWLYEKVLKKVEAPKAAPT